MYQISLKLQRFIFYSIILFLPTQAGKHFWPAWSYISGIRVDYLSPTIYFTDVLIVLLFFLWVFKNLNIKNSLKIKNYKLKIILFIMFLLFGIIQSKNPMAGLYGLFKLLEFGFFGWYVSAHIKKNADMQRIVLLFSCGVIFESSLAIAQYLLQGSLGGLLYFFGERTFTSVTPGIANAELNSKLVLRPYATFPHPNVLAGYLTIAMTILVSSIKYQVLSIKKILFSFSIVIGTIALFLTMSRVAIVLWVIIVMLNLFQHLKITRFRNKFGMTVLFIVVVVIFIFSSLHTRFSNFQLTDESVTRRIELIKTATVMVQQHPIFGVGPNNFLSTLPFFQKTINLSLFSFLQPVHNIFFLIASEVGIVGLLVVLLFFRKTIQNLRKKKKFSIFNFQF